MHWLRNCWYAAAWADDLAPGASLARTIVNAPILLWRDAEGMVRALADRCAHRFGSLSLGNIQQNIVHCGYHGVSYDGDTSRCVRNPHGPLIGAFVAFNARSGGRGS